MTEFKKYRKREHTTVVAVRLDLKTDGFSYQKWGATQSCKAGDWLLKNGDETYTVDASTFETTYREESPGIFRKVAAVWAKVAEEDGATKTKEGSTEYKAGDYLVFNEGDEDDKWAISASKFEKMYMEDHD